MADGSFDDFDTGENEEVLGSGGYVDDHIDIDDDDDDDPLVPSTPRAKTTPKLAQSPKSLKRKTSAPTTTIPAPKKPRTEPSNVNEYLLRAAGTGEARDYFVAKFLSRMPNLNTNPVVRMYRDGEATVDGRKHGLEAHKRQIAYYNSYSGRQRMDRYRRQGIDVVPDRAKKGMNIQIAPPHVAQQLEEHNTQRNEKKLKAFKTAAARGPPLPGMRQEPEPDEPDPPHLVQQSDTFTGVFDGKTRNTRYAIMVMNTADKTVDVVPIDDYAWFTFRAERNVPANVQNEEKNENVTPKKVENRLARFTSRYNAFHSKRNRALGDDLNSHEEENGDFADIGIRRRKFGYEDEDIKGEDLDFDEEFADDDVAQIDKEAVEKPVRRVQGDAEQNRRKLRKLIKDEPKSEFPPRSPGSESEEDGALGQGSQQGSQQPSRTASPSRPPSGSRSPKDASGVSPAHSAARQGTPMGASPSNVSPSPSRSSRGSTPRRAEVAHLLPAPGVPPTKEQVVGVLTVLLKGRSRMVFKEFMSYFEANNPTRKAHMLSILKSVAIVSADPRRPKKHYISFKPDS